MKTLDVRVARRWREADGIEAFELLPARDDVVLPAYEAGAHITVHLPNGLRRTYSLCDDPTRGGYRIAVLKETAGRGGSRCMHEDVHAGDALKISPPRNAFPLHEAAGHTALLAGGVGITPLLAMAYALQARGAPFELHYFARSRARVAFLAELTGPELADKVRLHIDDEIDEPGSRPLERVLDGLAPDAHVYACGPSGFLGFLDEQWRLRNRLLDHFHFEAFGADMPAKNAGDFDVRIASTGQIIHVGGKETVAAALERGGIAVPLSCEQGICGTCMTGVKAGIPEHRDQYLSEEERSRNDCFTPCCSRSKSPLLVLDL
jgi:vanillate monooxygenase ferredoxin subunit